MIRNLKALGLALVAMMAFGAVMASGASAQNGQLTPVELIQTETEGGETHIHAGKTLEEPFTLTGEEVGAASENRLTAFGSRVQCPGSTYTGHKYEVTPHELIPYGAETVTITPHYVNCTATALGFPATVTMNGCDYGLHLEGTTGGETTYGVLATLECPNGGPQVHIYKLGTEHKEENLKCTLTIDPNEEGYKGLHATDETNGHVRLNGTVGGIKVTQHEGPAGGCLPGGTTTEAGALDMNVTVDADNEFEETIGIGISHE